MKHACTISLAFLSCLACGHRGYYNWIQPEGRHPEVPLSWTGGNCRQGFLTEWRTHTSHTGLACYPEEFIVVSGWYDDGYESDRSVCYIDSPACVITLTANGVLPRDDEVGVNGVGASLFIGDQQYPAVFTHRPGSWSCTVSAPKPSGGEYVTVTVSMFIFATGPWVRGEVHEVRLETDLRTVQ